MPTRLKYDIQTGKTVEVKLTQAEVDASGLTPAQSIEQHNAPILAKLTALDKKRIRPMAEGDGAYLAMLNSEIAALRATLK